MNESVAMMTDAEMAEEFMPSLAMRLERAWGMLEGDPDGVRASWIAAGMGLSDKTVRRMVAQGRWLKAQGLPRPASWKQARRTKGEA